MANHEHISFAGSKGVVDGIFDMHNVEASIVTFTVSDDSDTAHVATTCNHRNGSGIELDEICDLARRKVDFDRVINLDQRVGKANSSRGPDFVSFCFNPNQAQRLKDAANSRSGIMRNQVGYSSSAELHSLNLAQLVFCLFSCDAMNSKASLGIVDQSEVFSCLLNRDDIHEASGVGRISSDLAIDTDKTLHEDCLHFFAIKRILETKQQ